MIPFRALPRRRCEPTIAAQNAIKTPNEDEQTVEQLDPGGKIRAAIDAEIQR